MNGTADLYVQKSLKKSTDDFPLNLKKLLKLLLIHIVFSILK